MRQHLAESRPASSRHVTDAEPVAMTTLAPPQSSSSPSSPSPSSSSSHSVHSTVVVSTESSTTERDVGATDESGDGANAVDSLDAEYEECICDYDEQAESRFDFAGYSAFLNP